jgi:hypothetical protein
MWIRMHTTTMAKTALLLGLGLSSSAAFAATGGTANTGAATNAPAGHFEGDVTMQVTTPRTSGPQKVTMSIKGDQVRYALPASSNAQHEPVDAVVDVAKKQVTIINPAQKTYAVLDLDAVPPQSKQATAQNIQSAAADWKAAPTGTTKTVAGQRCNQWQATDTKSSTKIDACLTPGVRIDFDKLLPASMLPASWADKLRNGELPLAATVYAPDGKETFSEQVTSVTPRTLPESDFTPPAGYKKVTLPLTAFGDLLPTR